MVSDPDMAAGAGAPAARDSVGAPEGSDPFARADPPLWEAALWPHRSLTRSGFRWFLGALAAGLSVPLLAAWGTPAAAALAPFLIGALALVWWAVRFHDRRRARCGETVRVWCDLVAVEHCAEDGRVLRWSANPYWVKVDLRDTRKAERYLTLSGEGRTIEIGAFLSPEERCDLAEQIQGALRTAASGGHR